MCIRPRQHQQGVALQATCTQPKADRHRRWLPRCLRQDRPEGERLAASSLRGYAATSSQRGISLIELIMFIVIVSVAVAGILQVMNVTEKGSTDPLIHKQALAAAQSLLEEIELQDFTRASGAAVAGTVTQGNRASAYHIVKEYDTFATTGIYTVDGTAPIVGLEKYNASVTVTSSALGSITSASGNALLITVTVTDPQGNTMQVSGYRTAY